MITKGKMFRGKNNVEEVRRMKYIKRTPRGTGERMESKRRDGGESERLKVIVVPICRCRRSLRKEEKGGKVYREGTRRFKWKAEAMELRAGDGSR